MRQKLIATLTLLVAIPTYSMAQDGTTYAFDIRTRDNFLKFSASDPSGLEFINKNFSPFAIDFDAAGTTLYAVDSDVDRVGTVNQATGQFTTIADLSGDFAGGIVTGLSVDPTDGSYYMSTATQLFTIDVDTGATVLAGTFENTIPLDGNVLGTVIDISIDASGQMYAHTLDPDGGDGVIDGGLWSVDNSSGGSQFVGSSGLQALFAQGMDFDPATDTLYASIYTGGGTGSYGTWNTTTGVFTEILDLPAFGPAELEIAISGGTTFAFNFRTAPNQFHTFPLNAPVPFDSSADIQSYDSFAMDFAADGTTLVLFDNNSNFFGTINTENGCFTPTAPRSGDLVIDPAGMSCDPTTGIFYLVADGGPLGGDELHMVDVNTGITTFMSSLADGGGVSLNVVTDIAFDNDGNLYAYDIGTDSLYSIVTVTGVATLVGQPGVGDSNFAQGMDFDPVTNTLYQAIYTGGGTGSYGSWDLVAGTFTEILPLPAFFDPIGTGYELEMAIGQVKKVLLGDVNCDGEVNLLDVQLFVDLITSGGFSPKADFDGDGEITLLDVSGFVAALVGG